MTERQRTMSLEQFFSRSADLSTGPQPDALATLYAETSVVGGPTGSHACTNDDSSNGFGRSADFNRQHAMRALTTLSIRGLTLSPIHTLATVIWGARFETTRDRVQESSRGSTRVCPSGSVVSIRVGGRTS
jgi:hypothetical protein